MLKKTKGLLLLSAALFSGASLAEVYLLKPNATLFFKFAPNEPYIIRNPSGLTLSGHCTLETIDESNDLKALMLNKSGKVNGIELTENQSIVVAIHNKQRLELSAAPFAHVEITNIGDNKHTVKAACTT